MKPKGTWYSATVANGYELWIHSEDGHHTHVGTVYCQPTAQFICDRMNEPSFQMVLDMGEEKFKQWYAKYESEA